MLFDLNDVFSSTEGFECISTEWFTSDNSGMVDDECVGAVSDALKRE